MTYVLTMNKLTFISNLLNRWINIYFWKCTNIFISFFYYLFWYFFSKL